MNKSFKSRFVILYWMLGFIAVVFSLPFLFSIHVEGHSMKPTFNNGDRVFFTPFEKKPEINNVVFLSCSSSWCLEENDQSDLYLIKRVKKINSDGCIWIEGDNDPDHSSDSREFGWLCPENFKIKGTVIKTF